MNWPKVQHHRNRAMLAAWPALRKSTQTTKTQRREGKPWCLLRFSLASWLVCSMLLCLRASWGEEEKLPLAGRLRDRDATIRLAVLNWMQDRWQELQSGLRQASREQRRQMVQELEQLRQQTPVVAELARQDSEEVVRRSAIQTLAVLQPDLRQPPLRQTWEILLRDRSPRIALAAAESLSTWLDWPLREINNPHAELRVLELIERLAADMLILGPTWELGLQHEELAVRQATLRALRTALTTLPQRLIGQQDAFRDAKLRDSALAALRDLTGLVERLESQLDENLALPHTSIRQPICEILEALGELLPVLRHSDLQPTGEKLADRLERPLNQLVPALLAVLGEDSSAEVRLASLSALETVARISPQTYPAFLAALQDPDPWVRWTAARCLEADRVSMAGLRSPTQSGRLREEDEKRIVRGLASRLLEEEELGVRLRLVQTLRTWKSQLDAAAQPLAAVLQQATSAWPGMAATVDLRPPLPGMGPFAPAHVGVPQTMRDPEVLLELLTAIREFAEQRRRPDTSRLPEEWLNGVSAALRAEKAAVRVEACRVLGLYGSRAYRLRQTLVPLLQDADPQVRAAAAPALLRITPPTD